MGMSNEALSGALRALGGVISTAWLGCFALAVIVFGAGGWEQWPIGQPVCHSVTEDSIITDCAYQAGVWTSTVPPVHPTPQPHTVGQALACLLGVAVAAGLALAWSRRRR